MNDRNDNSDRLVQRRILATAGAVLCLIVAAVFFFVSASPKYRKPGAEKIESLLAIKARGELPRIREVLGTKDDRAEFNDLIRSIARLAEPDRGEVVQAVCEVIRKSFDSSDLLARQRIHELWGAFRSDISDEAVERLANVMVAGPDDFVKEDALRVLAFRANSKGNVIEAERIFSERVTLSRSLLDTNTVPKHVVALAEYDLAAMLAKDNKWAEALDVCRTDPTYDTKDSLAFVSSWYQFKSLAAERGGDRSKAADYLRLLLREIPEFGVVDGRNVEVQAKVIELTYSDRDPRKSQEFLKLWDQEKNRNFASVLSVGNNAAVLLKFVDHESANRVVSELDRRFEYLWPSLSLQEQELFFSQRLSTRIKLAEHYIVSGNSDAAFDVLAEMAKALPRAMDNVRFAKLIDQCRPR
jgi:tetratricopeptide (TPR) repeat protein